MQINVMKYVSIERVGETRNAICIRTLNMTIPLTKRMTVNEISLVRYLLLVSEERHLHLRQISVVIFVREFC
jgi:hypothetical protein